MILNLVVIKSRALFVYITSKAMIKSELQNIGEQFQSINKKAFDLSAIRLRSNKQYS